MSDDTNFDELKKRLLNRKYIAILLLVGVAVIGVANFKESLEKLFGTFKSPIQEISKEEKERIVRLEKLVLLMGKKIAEEQAIGTPPKDISEIVKAREEIQAFIPKVRKDPSVLQPPLDVAIVVGHHPSSPGGIGTLGDKEYSEFSYNFDFAPILARELQLFDLSAEVFFRDSSKDFRSGMVAATVRSPRIIIELHANSSGFNVGGSEAFVRKNDDFSKHIAKAIVDSVSNSIGFKNRGVKTIQSRFMQLKSTSIPAMGLELFFIDKENDLRKAVEQRERLANAIAVPLAESLMTNR